MAFEHNCLGPNRPCWVNLAVAGSQIPLVEGDVIRYQEILAFAVSGNGVVVTVGGRRCATDVLFAVAIFVKVELVASTEAVGKGHQLISLTDPVRIIGRAMTTLCKNGVAVEQAGQQHGDNHDFGVQPAVVRPIGFLGVVAAISPRTHEHARKSDEHQSSND